MERQHSRPFRIAWKKKKQCFFNDGNHNLTNDVIPSWQRKTDYSKRWHIKCITKLHSLNPTHLIGYSLLNVFFAHFRCKLWKQLSVIEKKHFVLNHITYIYIYKCVNVNVCTLTCTQDTYACLEKMKKGRKILKDCKKIYSNP